MKHLRKKASNDERKIVLTPLEKTSMSYTLTERWQITMFP